MIVFDPEAQRVGEDFNPLFSVLAILPSIPQALTFNLTKELTDKVPQNTLLLCQMGLQTIWLLILAVIFNDAKFDFSD